MDKNKLFDNLTSDERELTEFVDSLRVEKLSLENAIKEGKLDEQAIQNRKIILDNEVLFAQKELEKIKQNQFKEKNQRLEGIIEKEHALGERYDELQKEKEILDARKVEIDKSQDKVDAITAQKKQVDRKRTENINKEKSIMNMSIDLESKMENLKRGKFNILERESLIKQRESAVKELETKFLERETALKKQEDVIALKFNSLDDREKNIANQESVLSGKINSMKSKISDLEKKKQELLDKEQIVLEKENKCDECQELQDQIQKDLDFRALTQRKTDSDFRRREKTVIYKEKLLEEKDG